MKIYSISTIYGFVKQFEGLVPESNLIYNIFFSEQMFFPKSSQAGFLKGPLLRVNWMLPVLSVPTTESCSLCRCAGKPNQPVNTAVELLPGKEASN